MNNKIILTWLLVAISFSQSCVKDEYTFKIQGEWVLGDGVLHLENLETGTVSEFVYFNDTISENCMDIDGTCKVADFIRKNQTKWVIGENFISIDDSMNYELYEGKDFFKFYPLEDGSARIWQIYSYSKNEMIITGRETYESLDGINYRYYSILKFIKS